MRAILDHRRAAGQRATDRDLLQEYDYWCARTFEDLERPSMWSAVNRVADRLLEQGRLSDAEARDLMPDHIFLNGDPRPLWQRLEFEKNLYGTTGQDAASGFSPVQDVPPDSQNVATACRQVACQDTGNRPDRVPRIGEGRLAPISDPRRVLLPRSRPVHAREMRAPSKRAPGWPRERPPDLSSGSRPFV